MKNLIKKISEIISVKSVIFGVHIHYVNAKDMQIRCIEVHKKGNDMNIVQLFDNYHNIDQLLNGLPNSSAICISISGKNIITKKINTDINNKEQSILNMILPNANIKDFYIQKTKADNDELFVSAARKQTTDEIFEKFQKKNCLILNTTFGPFALNSLSELLSLNNKKIKFNEPVIEIKDFVISNIKKVSSGNDEYIETFNLSEKVINTEQLICFSNVFSYFFPLQNHYELEYNKLNKHKEDFKYKNLFKLTAYAAVIIFLCLLLINFFLFENYSGKYNDIHTQYEQSIDNIKLSDSLTELIRNKEQFINDNTILNRTKFSYYADRLVLKMPHSILLNSIDINPQLKRIKKENEILFDKKKIIINGVVQSSTDMGNWINILKEEDWVKEIIVGDYKFDDRKQKGIFEIELKIK